MISQIYETENSNYSNVFRNCINSVPVSYTHLLMKYIEFEEIDSTNTYIHDHYQELDDDSIITPRCV